MKRAFKAALLGFSLIVFLSGLSEASEYQIVGKWAAAVRTKGGLGASYTFTDSGIVVSSFGALVDFDYRIEGQILKTNLKSDKTEEADLMPFEIVGDKLIFNPSDPNKRQEMTRTTIINTKAHPIVGIWSFKHYTGGMATMQYTAGGLEQLSVPFENSQGRYKLQGQALYLEFEGTPTIISKIRLEENRLIFLADGNEEEKIFIRVLP